MQRDDLRSDRRNEREQTACATPAQRVSAASISPSSIRNPRILTWKSLRPHVLHCATVDPPDHVTRAVQPLSRRPERGLRQNDPLSMPAVPGIHERPEHPTRTTHLRHQPERAASGRPRSARPFPESGPPMFIRSNAVSVSLMFEATVDSVGPYALKNPRTPPSRKRHRPLGNEETANWLRHRRQPPATRRARSDPLMPAQRASRTHASRPPSARSRPIPRRRTPSSAQSPSSMLLPNAISNSRTEASKLGEAKCSVRASAVSA